VPQGAPTVNLGPRSKRLWSSSGSSSAWASVTTTKPRLAS
jgi:hypothetical protein